MRASSPRTLGVGLTLHCSEQLSEFHETVRETGHTPVGLLAAEGFLDAAHHPGPLPLRRGPQRSRLSVWRRPRAAGAERRVGRAFAARLLAPRQRARELPALPRRRYQHGARHRHLSARHVRGDAHRRRRSARWSRRTTSPPARWTCSTPPTSAAPARSAATTSAASRRAPRPTSCWSTSVRLRSVRCRTRSARWSISRRPTWSTP